MISTEHSIDVKPDNVLLGDITEYTWIKEQLVRNPIAIAGEYELNGVKYPILKPQPILHYCTWDMSPRDAESSSVYLVSLGHSMCSTIFLFMSILTLVFQLNGWTSRLQQTG